jgi:hypothetical protein
LTLLISFLLFNANIDVSQVPRYEASAIGQLRNIGEEQASFRQAHKGCFASDLHQLPNVVVERYHYIYAMGSVVGNDKACVTRYAVTASPMSSEKTSSLYFLMDEKGAIRFEATHPATIASHILK